MTEVSKYKLLYTIRYFGDACFYPFLALYYKGIGLIESKVAILMAITPLVAILINPFYNLISKNVNINRQILRIITILEALIIILIPNLRYLVPGRDILVLQSVLVGLLALFGSSHYSLLDAMCATFANVNGINYSSIRVYGSAAYVVATTIAGFVNQGTGGYEIAFYLAAIFFVISSLAYTMINPVDLPKKKEQIEKRNLKEILANLSFLSYILFYALVLGTMVVGDTLFPNYLQERGISDQAYGIIFSAFVTFEAATLWYMNREGYRYKDQVLLLVATLMVIIRCLTYGTWAPMWLVIIITMMRGMTWGIILNIHFRYIIRLLGLKNATLGILILALVNNLFVGLGTIFGGAIIQHFNKINEINEFIKNTGYRYYYLGLSGFAFLGLLFLLATQFRIRKPVLKNN